MKYGPLNEIRKGSLVLRNLNLLQTITGTVERQSAHFYRVTVTEADLRAGVIITCTSAGNDKFKVSDVIIPVAKVNRSKGEKSFLNGFLI